MKQIWMAGILILACLVVGGCRNESQRLADMADRTVEMQSDTNSTVAGANEELAKLNRDVQAERKELNQSFEQLENDRRELNKQRRSELAWAESFRFLAIVIAAALPLFLCAYLIWAATRNTNDAELVNEVLMQELVSQRPRLIAGPNLPAIEDRQRGPDGSSDANHYDSTSQLIESNKGGNLNDVAHSPDND